ncbi:hypothetical protein Ciccas_007027, partial [Cichlidogyrus casuarinus]
MYHENQNDQTGFHSYSTRRTMPSPMMQTFSPRGTLKPNGICLDGSGAVTPTLYPRGGYMSPRLCHRSQDVINTSAFPLVSPSPGSPRKITRI